MKVLVVTNLYPHADDPSFGTFVFDQVRALETLGVELEVLFINGRSSRWQYIFGVFRFWRKLLRSSYDLIHAHYVLTGYIARMQFGKPVIVSFHSGGSNYELRLCRLLAPLLTSCTVTSKRHWQLLGFNDAHIVPCGVDHSVFVPEPQSVARERLGLPKERKIMSYIGALRSEKRVDLLNEAYQLLCLSHSDLDFLVVHQKSHDQIPAYLNASDVLVLASDFEGSPVIIKEAMACNLPIVSVAVGDVEEVIGETEGCYISRQNPSDLAKNIERALAFGKRTNGREAITHLQIEGEARRILELYNEAV